MQDEISNENSPIRPGFGFHLYFLRVFRKKESIYCGVQIEIDGNRKQYILVLGILQEKMLNAESVV